jgi:glycosyltransferase involved in cell wall biosynthesis
VVVPCYNDELWVKDAIQTCLNQTFPPVEIIVVDDGSTDRSREIVKSFGNPVSLLAEPHAGGSAARNRGWQIAKGEWVQFLDADDLLDANKLERHVPKAVEAGSEAATFCASRVVEMSSGRELHKSFHPPGISELERLFYEPVTPCMPLYHRSALERVGGFDESLPNCQDRDLHFRLWMEGIKLVPFAETLVTIRKRSGSVCSNTSSVLRNLERVFEPVIGLQDTRFTDTSVRALTARMFAEAGRGLAKIGFWQDCLHFHRIALKLDPEAVSRCYGRFTWLLFRLGGPRLANVPQRLRELKKNAELLSKTSVQE